MHAPKRITSKNIVIFNGYIKNSQKLEVTSLHQRS